MNKEKGSKGFSLVELIIVIAIMAILVAVLTPAIIRYIEKSREATDTDTCDEIYRAIANELVADTEIFKADAADTAYFKVTVDKTGVTFSGDINSIGTAAYKDDVEKVMKALGISADATNYQFSTGLKARSRKVRQTKASSGPLYTADASFSVTLYRDERMEKNIVFIK